MSSTFEQVVFFDTEASTDINPHRAYLVSFYMNNQMFSFYGKNCIRRFLERLPNNTLAIAHNLSYDFSFIINYLTIIYSNPIIKNSRVLQLTGAYKVIVYKDHKAQDQLNRITFKDSYAIITKPLKLFPEMFQLDSGRKEVFPYNYYNSTNTQQIYGNINEALEFIPINDQQQFLTNLEELDCIKDDNQFNMRTYAEFYCEQDVRILQEGFMKFRQLLLNQFNLDAFNFVSISSIANRYMELNCYWKNNNLYDLANTPRDFISRCIIGGRCMLADNTKSINEQEPLVDFDAVSLYPSAINRLYLLEGMPQVLQPNQLNSNYLLSHLFEEEQVEPTNERFISGFFIEAQIVHVGIKRHFPLIVWNHDINNEPEHERSTNDTCLMYMDHITFQDLINFQHCIIQPIRGYYYSDKRDYLCRQVIANLFNLRLKYKAEKNPLQEIIKLILNSIYGKTILKPIDEQYKFIQKNKLNKYIINRYNYIKEITGTDGSTRAIAKEIKPFNKHFTFCPFGVNVLSMSKRIMSEVIYTLEDLGFIPKYTDTDSFFVEQRALPLLEKEFKKRYGRELIGKNLGQFHCDSPEFGSTKDMPFITRSVFVMKKCYVCQLLNNKQEIAFVIRLKGVIPDVIVHKANQLFPNDIQCNYEDGLVYPIPSASDNNEYSIIHLYKQLFNGQSIEFDLATSKLHPCFDLSNFQVNTRTSFIRKIGLSN